jgi:hypothetical protein
MRMGGPHKFVWTTWEEKKLNLPDSPASNVRFTPTKIFGFQLRFPFNWDMAPCRWTFPISRVECPMRTGFWRLKHLLFQLRHVVYLTLLSAACFGFLYEAMHKVEGRNRVKSYSKLQNPIMYPHKVKGKFRPRTSHEGLEGDRGIALLFL